MIYNYCGIVFKSDIMFPFFYEDKENTPDFEIKYSNNMEDFDNSFPLFYRNNEYILNLGEHGYYKISKKRMICHFRDLAYMYATICNLPFAILSIMRGMIPCHSSSLMINDQKTLLFLGEKGVGKTTVACVADRCNLGNVYGDDMVTVFKTNNQLKVNRGSKLLKITPETALIVDKKRILYEVYPGIDKKYYIPCNCCSEHSIANLDKFVLLERGKEISYKKVPFFLCKPLLARHIVGISILEQFFSQEINDILNMLDVCDVYKLTVPDTINDLKISFHKLINTIKEKQGDNIINAKS